MQWRPGLCSLLAGITTLLGTPLQTAGAPPVSPGRSAQLLPPLAAGGPEAAEVAVARAQAEPLPSLGMTPVRRNGSAVAPATSPSWLSGTAPPETILPAAAALPARPASTRSGTPDSPSRRTAPLFESLLPAQSTNASSSAAASPAASGSSAHAAMPFRGATAQGTVVYAGPPAYRWYGYGAASPPAFLVHSQGQYPRASTDWYHITGATAGAFPVPITAPAASSGTGPSRTSSSVASPAASMRPSSVGPSSPPESLPPAVLPTPSHWSDTPSGQSRTDPATGGQTATNTFVRAASSPASTPLAPAPPITVTPVDSGVSTSLASPNVTVTMPTPNPAPRTAPSTGPTADAGPIASPAATPAGKLLAPEAGPWKPVLQRPGHDLPPASSGP
ncbi:MAG: hypothetical protein RMJ88_09845 [Thermogemmata sp.]|nr:hypothetical protein [Thermogemmata sp.]